MIRPEVARRGVGNARNPVDRPWPTRGTYPAMARSRPSPACGFLGIEAGGTRTTACWQHHPGDPVRTARFGPANLQLLSDRELQSRLGEIARALPTPLAVAIGMAGARTEIDFERIRRASRHAWPQAPCHATNDLEVALAATDHADSAGPVVLVLSGTGSCCYGRAPRGASVQIGGWGHLLGDQGSAYDIALQALRRSITLLDQQGDCPPLASRLVRALRLNAPNQLIPWIRNAPKEDVAALAPEVFTAALAGDRTARAVIAEAAQALARSALAAAHRLTSGTSPVRFVLAGGVLRSQPGYARRLRHLIHRDWPKAEVIALRRPGAEGAIRLARISLAASEDPPPATRARPRDRGPHPFHREAVIPRSSTLSPTELPNPRSRHLDRLPLRKAIRLMLTEESQVPIALQRQARPIERAIEHIVRALHRGGHLYYVGAGTSGRLGVLDASECPPTFRTPPDWVQGIIAGGASAVFRAAEGAEDDFPAGAAAMQCRRVNARDVVVGIAASGRTPFVWGALAEAKRRGAVTILVCFHPTLQFQRGQRPDVVIAPAIGPEVLTGSTRLKAGTATKLILNLLTTLAMVQLGKVMGHWMIDLHPSNQKLRERAVRITGELTGAREPDVRATLANTQWNVRAAVTRLGVQRRGSKTGRP